MPTDIPIIKLKGSHAMMGEAFGEQCREKIKVYAELRMEHLLEWIRQRESQWMLRAGMIWPTIKKTIGPHRIYDNDIWAEFEGIARGADIPVEKLLLAGGYTDFRDLILTKKDAIQKEAEFYCDYGECTAILVPPCCAKAGQPLLAQTWDMNPEVQDFIVIVLRQPDHEPVTLCLTTVGSLCLIGINQRGVAIGTTNLVPKETGIGVNYLFTITRAFKAGSAVDAAREINQTDRLSGHNFLIASENTAINLETTSTRCEETKVIDKPHVHTNHYQNFSMRMEEDDQQDLRGSRWRHSRMQSLIASSERIISIDDCWRLLSDEKRQDGGAILNNDFEGMYGEFATVATVVMSPNERIFQASLGPLEGAKRVTFKL